MPLETYSEKQREYWVKRPANVLQFMTLELFHPDFDFIRLVANQFSNKTFLVGNDLQEFTAVSMVLPAVTNQETDSTRAGAITFGNLGLNFRRELLKITPFGAIMFPITVMLRQYEDGVDEPIYQRRLYVGNNGITISTDNVSIQLSVDNPARLTKQDQFYDPEVWTGLQGV